VSGGRTIDFCFGVGSRYSYTLAASRLSRIEVTTATISLAAGPAACLRPDWPQIQALPAFND